MSLYDWEGSIEGKYISASKNEFPFTVNVYKDYVTLIIGGGESAGFRDAVGHKYSIDVTKQEFKNFKENVLDKDVGWKNIRQIKRLASIPGTWISKKKADINGNEPVEVFEAAISGTYPINSSLTGGVSSKKSKRNRRSTRRKSNKLRRSRRNIIRKTKKCK
jgi:hypothetical protein